MIQVYIGDLVIVNRTGEVGRVTDIVVVPNDRSKGELVALIKIKYTNYKNKTLLTRSENFRVLKDEHYKSVSLILA